MAGSSQDAEIGADVTLDLSISPAISYAMVHNRIPLLRGLTVRNGTTDTLEGIDLRLSTDPDLGVGRTWRIDRLAADRSLAVQDLDVPLDGGRLRTQTEAMSAEVSLTLTHQDQIRASICRPLRVLAANEWGGLSTAPELIASFVMPNDPTVAAVLGEASRVLRRAGKSPALDGYESGARSRVYEIGAAIWAAIAQQGIGYALPPASFEEMGQKVRFPSEIGRTGLATCLDTTLLFAACLEQAGLNPILLFAKGHAFAGQWLQPEEFRSVITDDPVSLRKRIDLDEIVVFETTLVTRNPAGRFAEAVDEARARLAVEQEADFLLALDVRQARIQRILPLPSDTDGEPARAGEPLPPIVHDLEEAPELADFIKPDPVPDTPATRLDRWQRKLLDLTIRNKLLNLRQTKGTIPIIAPQPGALEDALADGKTIAIIPLPKLTENAVSHADVPERRRAQLRIAEDRAAADLARAQVTAAVDGDDLDGRLVDLFRKARGALQDGGSNVLFLALGLLRWRRGEHKNDRTFSSPLILLPVTLERKSVASGVKLKRHEDEARFNPTLLEMLRQDFGVEIPGVEPLPHDEHGYDVDRVWSLVRQAVKTLRGFDVVADVILSDFSFAKFLMWRDLTDRIEALKANRVVHHLIETPRDPFPAIGSFPDPRSLDRDMPPEKTFAPLPVDSSQLAAVVAATRGLDMIIEGPPGTGKSQTIANIIAQTLAEGRTVLFVSEKTAALEVVYRRLAKIGLADFCLQLHSNRANKKEVLEQLRTAWDARGDADEAAWAAEAARLKALRDRLNQVAEQLHRPYRNGLTPYLAMARVVAGRDQPAPRLAWPSVDTHDRAGYEVLRALAGRIDRDAIEIGPLADNPLTAIREDEWRFAWEEALVAATRALAEAARGLDRALLPLATHFGLDPASDRRRLDALAALSAALADIGPEDDLSFAIDADAEPVLEQARKAVTIIDFVVKAQSGMSAIYADTAIAQLDLDGLAQRWEEAAQTWWPRSASLRGAVRKVLAAHCRGTPDPETDLTVLKRIRKAAATLDGLDPLRRLGSVWRGRSSDGRRLQRVIETAQILRQAVSALAAVSDVTEAALLATLGRFLREDVAQPGSNDPVHGAARQFCAQMDAFRAAADAFEALAKGPIDGLCDDQDRGWLERLAQSCDAVTARAPRLRPWCAWRTARAEAVTLGLEPLVVMVEAGEIAPGRAQEAFDVGYARWWSAAVIDEVEPLRTFVPAEHEMAIEDFIEATKVLGCAMLAASEDS